MQKYPISGIEPTKNIIIFNDSKYRD